MVVGIAAPVARTAAVTAAYDTETGQPLAAWECNTGNVCFWNGFAGTGGRCMWDVADPDWSAGSVRCSWAATGEVRSLYNRGTSSATGVVFYRGGSYRNRVGCARQGQRGDLAGTYRVRSHQWSSGPCG